MKQRHWVFDLDGTLVDSFAAFFESLDVIFKAQGKSFPPELRLAALTEHLRGFFETHLGRKAVEPSLDLLQKLSENDAVKIQPFDGVLETLKSIRENGERIAVWTNRDLVSAKLILKHSGIQEFIDLCVSGTCTTLRKPHPEGLLRIVKHFDCETRSVIMTGDHEHDVSAAREIGAIGVRASWHSYWKMKDCKIASHQFHTFDDFRKWHQRT